MTAEQSTGEGGRCQREPVHGGRVESARARARAQEEEEEGRLYSLLLARRARIALGTATQCMVWGGAGWLGNLITFLVEVAVDRGQRQRVPRQHEHSEQRAHRKVEAEGEVQRQEERQL
eukprot:COSAG01_NODE_836_length_13206_cov_139.627375_13_plen_119_part_00